MSDKVSPPGLAAEQPMGTAASPRIVVLSSLFPSGIQPNAGLFVRERMFRVGARLPLAVVAPTPWFPLQKILRRWKPHFRPGAPAYERQKGVDVWFPRFFSLPGIAKQFDGIAMALCAYPRMSALKRAGRLDLIDAHFGYPDGYAAVKLGKWLGVPVTITLRGTEARHARDPALAPLLRRALEGAAKVFAVSESLKSVAVGLGIPPGKIEVVGNGVDAEKFRPLDRTEARAALQIGPEAPVLISVGALVERKGFHRVIELLPVLREHWPGLVYLVVGGSSTEGNIRTELEALVDRLDLRGTVRFLGALPPERLAQPLSAADVFVLLTSNEGWANVFLEAMACGLPVVTTDVGGNREVVNDDELGIIVPFGVRDDLQAAVHKALSTEWRKARIRQYAESNSWDERVGRLCANFSALSATGSRASNQQQK